MFKTVKTRVGCGAKFTEFIICTRGVKQGDICSPVLFSPFINELALEIINNGKHGVHFFFFVWKCLSCYLLIILFCYLRQRLHCIVLLWSWSSQTSVHSPAFQLLELFPFVVAFIFKD